MTEIINSTALPETKRAELYALPDGFDWIVHDFADMGRVLDDTHAEYRGAIEANRVRHAGELDPSRVTFEFGTDGESLFVRTDLRSEARRTAG